jgi:hypothetical protein
VFNISCLIPAWVSFYLSYPLKDSVILRLRLNLANSFSLKSEDMKKIFTPLFQKLNFIFSFLLLLLAALIVDAQPTDQTFNANGTYVIPAGWTATVSIEVWGAGGSGGGGNKSAKTGGGGGGYARLVTTLTAGSYTVTVGKGGIAPTNANSGQDGGASSFAEEATILVSATGGSGGGTVNSSRAGGDGNPGPGITTHKGGNGGNANGNTGGGGGGSALAGADGNNGADGNGSAGGTGGTGEGNGGNGGSNASNGISGNAPGGGGGGKGDGNSAVSGNGADGRVTITIQNAEAALPVKFGTLTASAQLNAVELDWSSYTEENTDHYEVERSSNGQSFTVVGQVKAAGNSSVKLDYSWTDESPNNGNNFYRIKSVDFDGHLTYSSVIKITLGASTSRSIAIYPNPVKGSQLTLQMNNLQKGNYSVLLFNPAGQQVSRFQVNVENDIITQTLQLPSSVKPGVYNLLISNGALKLTKTFIVQ